MKGLRNETEWSDEVLKDAMYIGSDKYASDYDREMNKAIDTVVVYCEENKWENRLSEVYKRNKGINTSLRFRQGLS